MLLNKQKCIILLFFIPFFVQAQTLTDGIFMPKKAFCGGALLMQDQFKNYWEGTLKRDNANMGTMSMQAVGIMANYGITDKLNVIASLPYIKTQASAGQMAGWSGIQDLSMGLKYNILKINNLDIVALAGGSIPLTNYVAQHPFAIGTQSKMLFGRALVHYLNDKGWTAAAHSTYTLRSNIKIDGTNYYTDKNVNSNEVAVANTWQVGTRAGFYSYRWAFEGTLERTATLGGFDIRRNDVMFPAANRQEATRIGFIATYRIKPLADVQVVVNGAYTLAGRNVGQATSWAFGLMKALNFKQEDVEK